MVLFLVTGKASLPVGMAFYRPDPAQQAFKKEEARLIKAGVKPADRPKAPEPDKDYPNKTQIALNLIARFKTDHPGFTVKSVVADAAFGTAKFMEAACRLAGTAPKPSGTG